MADVDDSRPGARWSVCADTWQGLPDDLAALLAPPVVVSAEPARSAAGSLAVIHPPRERAGRMLVPAPPRVGRHRRRTAQPVAMA